MDLTVSRTIAVPEIHGCSDALTSLLRAIDPQPRDTIITLAVHRSKGTNQANASQSTKRRRTVLSNAATYQKVKRWYKPCILYLVFGTTTTAESLQHYSPLTI